MSRSCWGENSRNGNDTTTATRVLSLKYRENIIYNNKWKSDGVNINIGICLSTCEMFCDNLHEIVIINQQKKSGNNILANYLNTTRHEPMNTLSSLIF